MTIPGVLENFCIKYFKSSECHMSDKKEKLFGIYDLFSVLVDFEY